MAVYDYTALDSSGKQTQGVISADSPRSARKLLRLRQLSPLDVREARNRTRPGRQSAGRLSSSDLVLVTRQMAMLLKSGATVEEALGAIAGEAERQTTRRVLLNVRNQVQEGFSFSEALSHANQSFPAYYRSVIRSGQASGRLGDVMERLATHLEKSRKLRRKLLSALIYPAVLACVAMLVVALLMVFVVPAVIEQFAVIEQDLPALTEAVIAISEFIRSWGLVLLPLLLGAGWLIRRLFARPAIKQGWDRFILGLPLLGKVIRNASAAQFARTFATLSSSGAPVPDALIAARGAVGNAVFQKASDAVRRQVEEGQTLNRAMRETSVFPSMLVHMVASGEQGGDLPAMMGRAADYMEEELDSSATVALGLVEPLLIVLLAGIVALIVLAIMLPILQLNTLAIGV